MAFANPIFLSLALGEDREDVLDVEVILDVVRAKRLAFAGRFLTTHTLARARRRSRRMGEVLDNFGSHRSSLPGSLARS